MSAGIAVLVIVHRAEIADQTSNTFTAMGVAHGRIQPGYPMTDEIVQIGMIQTVAKRLDKIAEPGFIIIDESHHAVAETWREVLDAWPEAKVLGVSATPERLDGRGLGDIFQEMVIGPGVRELIEQGFLAPFIYLAPDAGIDLRGVRTLGGDYRADDLTRAVDRTAITGNVVQHYRSHLAGRTAIAFCITVAHAEHVAAEFRANEISAASIDGTLAAAERGGLVSQLRDGELKVLTSCELISEGFDAPAVGGAILLRPTQSFALFRQQIGRCLRPKPDGSAAVILDHVGNVFRHGMPDAPHEWSLESKPKAQRERQAAKEGIRKCRVCDTVFDMQRSVHKCQKLWPPGCLFMPAPPPDVREGTLIEVAPERTLLGTPEMSPGWARGISLRSRDPGALATLLHLAGRRPDRLRAVQEARGYAAGWIWHRMREAAEQSEVVS